MRRSLTPAKPTPIDPIGSNALAVMCKTQNGLQQAKSLECSLAALACSLEPG